MLDHRENLTSPGRSGRTFFTIVISIDAGANGSDRSMVPAPASSIASFFRVGREKSEVAPRHETLALQSQADNLHAGDISITIDVIA